MSQTPNSANTRKKYTGIIQDLEGMISDGRLAVGQRLPPQRVLARNMGVTIATLSKAISELRRSGMLVTRVGSGTFVASLESEDFEFEKENRLIDLRVNVPPTGPVREMLGAALHEVASRKDLLAYEPLGGSLGARAAGAQWLVRRDLTLKAQDILVVQGAHEGILATLRAVTRPGDRVLCEQLNYSGLRRLRTLLQIELIGIPISTEGIDIEAFSRTCRDLVPRVVIVTPNTQNPTTATMNSMQRNAVLAAAQRIGAIVIENDIYGHLSGPEPALARTDPGQVVYVTSLSKCLAPGLKVGYLVAPPKMYEAIKTALYALTWSSPALGLLAQHLINTGDADICLRAHRNEALSRMAIAREHLGGAIALGNRTAATPMYHGWLDLPADRRAVEFVAGLMSRQVLVSPAADFTQGEGELPNAVRISLGHESRAAMRTALQTIGNLLMHRDVMGGVV